MHLQSPAPTESSPHNPKRSLSSPATRRLGAEVIDGGAATRFRVYTDQNQTCQLRILHEDGSTARSTHTLQPIGGDCFEVTVSAAGHGTLYHVVLDGRVLPDPYARFLPLGVHGPAMVVQSSYQWRFGPGISRNNREHVFYEVHVGTFTPEGTYAAAEGRLDELAALGITTVELMPVSAAPGRWGWGYDGVAHFAPFAAYGSPDQLRRFVDEAHGRGLSVILDVVYNHFGPAGNYLPAFSRNYFSGETKNAWGDGPNFGHPAMRDYVLDNALYWLNDFRFDGLRLDATHAIVDPTEPHIIKELTNLAHGLQPRKIVVAEDNRNDPDLVLGHGVDAIWADDFHHVAHVTTTNECDGYYSCYAAGAAQLAETIRRGWLYEGQPYAESGQLRGKPADRLAAEAFVYCLQNHDQIGNRALGDRVVHQETTLERYCALSTLLLFLPMTPLLFMGQEWAASSPFCFFTDHEAELGKLITRGRSSEFNAFASFSDPRRQIPDPQAEDTFLRSQLRWEERESGVHRRVLGLYRDLLRLRRLDPVLREAERAQMTTDSEGPLLSVHRQYQGQERVLLVNLSDAAIDAPTVVPDGKTRKLLLRSDGQRTDSMDGSLPPWVAVVMSGVAETGLKTRAGNA